MTPEYTGYAPTVKGKRGWSIIGICVGNTKKDAQESYVRKFGHTNLVTRMREGSIEFRAVVVRVE